MHKNPVLERQRAAESDLVFVLVHGRTQNPKDMEAIADRLALDHVRFLFPAADGNSWYPDKFMAPVENNQPHLGAALEHYETIVSGLLADGVPQERIILGGFSQGACLTCQFIAEHPRRYGAAAIFTGGLIGPKGTVWPLHQQLEGMPAFLSTSEVDPWVPPERTRETHEWMLQSGARPQLKIFTDREHTVLDEEIAAVRKMVRALG